MSTVSEQTVTKLQPANQSGADYEQLFGLNFRKSKDTHKRPIQIDNEFNEPPRVRVYVQGPVIHTVEEKGEIRQQDLTQDLQRELDYLSATKGLEVNSNRTDIIQKYIDVMVQGTAWEGKARLVIMNKGIEPDAFAMPDGSIFISQSLINMLSSLDEIIAIIAHEVRHLTKGTSKARYVSRGKRGIDLGTRWIHEMSSDFGSPELLEKVGLKTTAEAEAFSKLAARYGNQRGTEHQAPIIRAVQQLAIHSAKDFETSHIDFTPIPSPLRAKELQTNMELLMDAIDHDDRESVKLYLENMHPIDLHAALETINTYRSWNLKAERNVELAKILGQILISRLQEQGYNEKQIKLLFLKFAKSGSLLYPDFKNLAEITGLIPIADDMDAKDEAGTASNLLFRTPMSSDLVTQLDIFARDKFDTFTDPESIELTHSDEILDYVEALQHVIDRLDSVSNVYEFKLQAENLNSSQWKVVYDYIIRFYIPNVEDGELDETQMEELFGQLHAIGVKPIENYPLNDRMLKFGNKNAQIISTAFERVFRTKFFMDTSPVIDDFQPLDDVAKEIQGASSQVIHSAVVREVEKRGVDFERRRALVKLALQALDHDSAFVEVYSAGVYAILDDITNKPVSYKSIPGMDRKDNNFKLKYWQEVAEQNNLLDDPRHQEILQKIKIERMRVKILLITDALRQSEGPLFEELRLVTNGSEAMLSQLKPDELMQLSTPLFRLSAYENSYGEKPYKVSDYDAFYDFLPVRLFHEKYQIAEPQNLTELVAAFQRMNSDFSLRYIQNNTRLFDDDPLSVIAAEPFREHLLQIVEKRAYSKHDYPILITLLKEHFPNSNQSSELIRTLQKNYIHDSEVTINEKIEFFFKNYKSMGPEGAVELAEQIHDVSTFVTFRKRLDELGEAFLSGEESADVVAAGDVIISNLARQAELLVKTASLKPKDVVESSTRLATAWIRSYFRFDNDTSKDFKYDVKTKKFIVSRKGRASFTSFSDAVASLKNLSPSKRVLIALKSLSDQNGLLITKDGKNALEKTLIEGTGLDSDLFKRIIHASIQTGDPKVVSLPAAQMLGPLLFRGLEPAATDIAAVRKKKIMNEANYLDPDVQVGKTDFAIALKHILNSTTDALRYFGARYATNTDSELGKLAQESNRVYFATLNALQSQLMPTEDSKSEKNTNLPSSIESLIRAGETSPIIIRGMQMAVQLIDFSPAVRERLLNTQDSMKGMDKLSFWENLLSKAENDPELNDLLQNKLISLDGYLGGGSLFTTFGATLKGPDGSPTKVVIKMLNPNAEEFIRLSYEFCSKALTEVLLKSRGETRKNAQLASSLLDLSYEWCLRDINDTRYEERDDAFRALIPNLDQQDGVVHIHAPERILTRKKIKIEAQSSGSTVNKFLRNADVPSSAKKQVVEAYADFFDIQFDTPITNPDGSKTYIFHSDPHTGNYMIDYNPPNSVLRLDVIDRSMPLALNEADVEMFRKLKDGNEQQFINDFIIRCLELSNITGNEALRIRLGVMNQLLGERLRQRLRGQNNPSIYLQIIMREFAKFGEKYTMSSTIETDDPAEKLVSQYLRDKQDVDVLEMFNALEKPLSILEVNAKIETYNQFKKMLQKMEEAGKVNKKSIKMPLEFRLMIRNTAAVKNVKDRWKNG